MSNVKTGDHIIFQNDLYGGTRNFIQTEFDKFGIQYSFTGGLNPKIFLLKLKKIPLEFILRLRVIHSQNS